MPSLLRSVFWILVFLVGSIVLWTQFDAWNALFLSVCPNKDSLVWDGNMRFVQAIDIVSDVRRGIFLPGIQTLLASPTWPPLRTLFSIVLLLWNGSPDPVLDTRPSAIFFFATILLLAVFAFRYRSSTKERSSERWSYLFQGLLFLTVLFLLLGIYDFPAFLFSSMLEIQGMFFFTWNGWALFAILRKLDAEERVRGLLIASFLLSGIGLYLTKYPFGILTGLSLVVVAILRSPKATVHAGLRVLRERYTGWHLIPLMLLVVAALVILIGPHLGTELVNTKFVKRFLYVSLLIVFLDFNYYLYRNRPQYFPEEIKIFYLYFLLPFLFVILSHPDRFGSLIQAQTDRVPGGSRFYPVALFQEYFAAGGVLTMLVLGGLLSGIAWIFQNRSRMLKIAGPDASAEAYADRSGERLLQCIPDRLPLSAELLMVIFLWCNILIMQFMTSNHQARYLFQIFPLFLFFHGAMISEVRGFLPVSYLLRHVIPIAIILPASLFALRPLYSEAEPGTRSVCFATMDPQPIEAARRIAGNVPADTDAVLLNDFHETDSPSNGRRQATEIDLFLRYRTYGSGRIRTDSRFRYPDWVASDAQSGERVPLFEELVHVSYLCGERSAEAEDKAKARATRAGAIIEPVERYEDPDGLCMMRYRIQ